MDQPFKLFCRSDEPVVETSDVESRVDVEADHDTFAFTVESSSRPVDDEELLSVSTNFDTFN